MKVFTVSQVLTLVFVIVAAIAFLESSQPICTGRFWRDFLLKLTVYLVAAEFAAIALATFVNWGHWHDDV